MLEDFYECINVLWKVEYQTLQGEKVVKRFEGRPAVIFQHEYDHLDKVCVFHTYIHTYIHMYTYIHTYIYIHTQLIHTRARKYTYT